MANYLYCFASMADKLYAGKPQDHYRHEGHRVLATLGVTATHVGPLDWLG
jgi:hypothetical protein